MADWLKVANSTIAKYVREKVPATIRERKLLALLEQRGGIKLNQSGTLVDWKVAYKEPPIQGYAAGDTLTFAQKERYKTAQLDWRGYTATDSIDKVAVEKNKSTEAIIKLFDDMVPSLMSDMRNNFSQELWLDGNATGRSKCIHGFESWLSVSGAASDGYVGVNNDTYAGLATAPGNYGGSWDTNSSNSTWPRGKGTVSYDFWTPLVVDYTDTAWLSGAGTWATTCRKAVRFAVTHQVRTGGREQGMDTIMLDPELFRQWLDAVSSVEQIQVQRNQAQGLVSLGFLDVFNYDGVEITREFGMPANVGYGIPVGQLELLSLQSELFKADKVEFDMATRSYRVAIDFLGNLRCKTPRPFVKFVAIT